MDAIERFEEIAEQANHRMNGTHKRNRGGSKFGWGVSPSIARASVSRPKKMETKKTPKPKAEKPPPTEPPRPAACARLGYAFSDYATLIEICRLRAVELELSRAAIDRIGGMPDGYAGKLLGDKGVRKIGPASLEWMLGALGLKLIVIVDESATARTLALREPVDKNQQRFGNVARLGAVLALPPPSQPASPPLLTAVPVKRTARGSKYS